MDTDSVCTDDNLAPFCIQVELARNPETVRTVVARNIAIGCCTIAPFIHGVGHVFSLIVRCSDNRVIKARSRTKCVSKRLVGVPSVKLVASARAGGQRNPAEIRDSEVHILAFRAPVERCVAICIRMQEHTVLDLAPLGVDGKAAVGHCGEIICLRASVVDIPALEHKACRRCRNVVVVPALVVGRQIRSVRDVVNCMKRTAVGFVEDVVVTVDVHAIHEVERIGKTVEINLH